MPKRKTKISPDTVHSWGAWGSRWSAGNHNGEDDEQRLGRHPLNDNW